MAAQRRHFPQTIAVCGGGNGAHVCCAYFGAIGLKVNLLTRKPAQWAKEISVTTKGYAALPAAVGGM